MDQQFRDALVQLRDPTIDDPIAELLLVIELPERRESQHIRIGRPLEINGVFVCPVESRGPIRVPSPSAGDNSLQSLILALKNIRFAIHSFVESNTCRVYYGASLVTPDALDRLFLSTDFEPK